MPEKVPPSPENVLAVTRLPADKKADTVTNSISKLNVQQQKLPNAVLSTIFALKFGQQTDNGTTYQRPLIFLFVNYLRQRRRLCFYPSLSVCLFVCLSARLLKKLRTDFDQGAID